ncbi:MAG: carboxylating nicotinate-nucleotide diphosphorylase [Anaerolineales bacterium]|nr:carboxylating nicotinate-nucleotide diphosphorylase [Anaerolineales bacterium]
MQNEILDSIRRALDEDIRTGDVTTDSIVPMEAMMNGKIIAKQNGVVAGLDIARAVFAMLDDSIQFTAHVDEGQRITPNVELISLRGHSRPLLTGERTALNYLGRMSGIATLTRQFVDAVSGTKAVILDTRKTAPGLRTLDKLAVKLGGGENHRIGLFDMILIKDNHIDFAGGIEEAVRRARDYQSGLEIEVETRTLEDVKVVLNLGIERILLDNMSIEMMNESVRITNGRAKLEASGNVSLETVRQIAETGVDYISVGALTHSAKVFDFSLQWIR